MLWRQEQQRVAVGPVNAYFIPMRQLSVLLLLLPPPPLLLLMLLCIGSLLIKN